MKGRAGASKAALHRPHLDDPGNRLDGAGDLRAHLVAARQLHLDFLAGAEHHDEVDFAGPLALPLPTVETFRHSIERSFVTHKDAKAPLDLGGRTIEGFDGLNAGPHLVALRLGGHLQQHRTAGLQKVAILRQPLGKDHRFILAGGIRQPDDAHLVARLGAPFRPRHHGSGDLAGRDAGFHGAGKSRPGLHLQTVENARSRTATMVSIAVRPTPLIAASAYRMVLPATSKSTPDRLIDGGSTVMPRRAASARNSASLSVLPMLSVIEAARNSTG